MRIRDVEAFWLHCPIPYAQQHVSDFGRLDSFDMTLVRVTTEDGRVGHGEAKAAVGSAGVCAALVACVEQELRPQLIAFALDGEQHGLGEPVVSDVPIECRVVERDRLAFIRG